MYDYLKMKLKATFFEAKREIQQSIHQEKEKKRKKEATSIKKKTHRIP